MPKPSKAIIYGRVSTADQAEHGTSLEQQQFACLRKAADLGVRVVAQIQDEGVSGALYLSRPGIQEALRSIEAGEADSLILHKLDRGGRDVDALRDIRKRLKRAGASLVFADGFDYADTPVGDLMYSQMAGFAEYERAVIRERSMGGKRTKAASGQQPSRARQPFGYHIVLHRDIIAGSWAASELGTYQVVERERPIVQEIFERCARGESLRAIARWLHASGVETRLGGRWAPQTVRGMLTSSTYKGVATHGKSVHRNDEDRTLKGKRARFRRPAPEGYAVEIACPAIVSEEVWQACQDRLAENQSKLGGQPKQRKALTSLMRCPICGRRMAAGAQDGERRYLYYRCGFSQRTNQPACDTTLHREDNVLALLASGLASLLTSEVVMSHSTSAKPVGDDRAEKRAALERDMAALTRREEATARAQVDAMVVGRPTEVYDKILTDLDTQRRAIAAAIDSLAEPAPALSISQWKPSEVSRSAIAGLVAALTSPAVPDHERNHLLMPIVQAIRPAPDGYEIELVPSILDGQGLGTVNRIVIRLS